MKKLQSLGRSLSKEEQKKIVGGGACYFVYSTQGYSSCWYITGSEIDLCERVYGANCQNVSHAVNCQSNGCIMQ